MTEQIAQAIYDGLDAEGVLVLVEAEHMCMSARGIKKPGSKTISMSTKGVFETDTKLKEETLTLIKSGE